MEHMGTPRRAAPAMWNPQCEEGAGGGAASANVELGLIKYPRIVTLFFLHRLIKAPRIMSFFWGRDSCSGIFFIVIVYFFPFEFAEICLSYRLLDGDFY